MTGLLETHWDFLTREPVEGELLAARLAAGSVSPEEAFELGIEIGSVLNRAHGLGMVHGCLSPHTVAINRTGIHILAPPPVPGEHGAAYRSPEQTRGEPPDWRSDVFAFGALLYLLAGGRPAFEGEGAALDRAILEDSPAPLKDSPANAAMEKVIAGCLEKDPARRRQRVQNAVVELKFAAAGLRHPLPLEIRPATLRGAPAQGKAAVFPLAGLSPRHRSAAQPRTAFGFRTRLWATVGLVLLLAAGAVTAVLTVHRRPAEPVLRFALGPPENTSYPSSPAVSPDGKYLTLSAVGPDGQKMLWLRPLDALRSVPIPGTEGGTAPFWSPDSRYIAFFARRGLKKVQIDTWNIQTICDAGANPGGGSWNTVGSILFAPDLAGGLFQVPSAGGAPEPVLQPKSGKSEAAFLWPQFLPDGRRFLFFALTNSENSTGVYAGSLDSRDYSLVLVSASNAVYGASPQTGRNNLGYLLFVRDRNLMAQSFNLSKLALESQAVTLAEDTGSIASLSLAPISVSNTSILVYQQVGRPTRQLVWIDRSGRYTAVVPNPAEWGPPRIAPGGWRAVAAFQPANVDRSPADLMFIRSSGTTVPFTNTPALDEGNPVWSPDGQEVAFSEAVPSSHAPRHENQPLPYDLFVRAVDGGGAELLFGNSFRKQPTEWSRDGRWLIFDSADPGTGHDIWAYSFPEQRAAPIVETAADEQFGALSPDGKWLAYQSDESGRPEVYVQSFAGLAPGAGTPYRLSQGGGGIPRWRADGAELFYLASTGQFMSVPVRNRGGALQFDPPQMLFQTRPVPKHWNWYDVSSDGRHFLFNLPYEFSSSSNINVISNWIPRLKD